MRSFLVLVFVGALGASAARADTVVFQDDFEGHTANTAMSAVTAPSGVSYSGSTFGAVRDSVTSPPGVGAGGSSQFVGRADSGSGPDFWHIDSDAISGKEVTYSMDVYVVGGESTTNAVDICAFTSSYSGAFDLGLFENGALKYYDGSAFQTVGTYRTGQWISVEVVADYAAGTIKADVDGTKFTADFMASVDSSDFVFLGPSPTMGFFYDNASVSIVPEPSTVVLLATGLLGLLAYAWRKRR